MGCSNCALGKKGDIKPAGCKSNGYCSSDGCNKFNVFDWLNQMDIPNVGPSYPYVEVRFKNGFKEYFKNENKIDLYPSDWVVVDVPNGHHIGRVSLQGELVRLQIKKHKIKEKDIRSIYRKASSKDLEKFEQAKNREISCLFRSREIIQNLKLNMKLSDIEFQADNTKATFFYSSEDRVDFRELIKKLAAEFKIRVEMRQISLRHEAGRLGGIGSCGRELCCSTWLSDLKAVSTSAARYQNLSLNPSKLSGQCGRLKCCLNYELDTYMAVLKDIPKVDKALKTKKGEATLMRTDIFRKIMYFGYKGENIWHSVDIERVVEIQKQNSNGIYPDQLTDSDISDDQKRKSLDADTNSNDLEALDRKYKSNKKKKKRNKHKRFQQKKNEN
ncbi:Signal peptidase-like protein [Hyphobacterium sp. CCMP332]|nr:Signal peptidase-like protein [Hyphobacterium sp. CCMP332]